MRKYFCIFAILLRASHLIADTPSLEQRYERIAHHSIAHGRRGLAVLKQAQIALSRGSYQFVGLEDLWATALKEGRTLFSTSDAWKSTTAAETGDMLGQTTVGPWQITLANARDYGGRCGVQPEWGDRVLIAYLHSHPVIQACLAAEFIEASYRELGRRSPLAIQRYFWLDGYQQKKIGLGPWYGSVLAKDPQHMSQTGFYAKQLLLGSRYNPEGLLYWLYRTGDEPAVLETLRLWEEKGHPIRMDDLNHCACNNEFRLWLKRFLRNHRPTKTPGLHENKK